MAPKEAGKRFWQDGFTVIQQSTRANLSRSIAQQYPERCWRVNYSATKRARLPERMHRSRGEWNLRIMARCFLTELQISIWLRKASSCSFFRTAVFLESATRSRDRSKRD